MRMQLRALCTLLLGVLMLFCASSAAAKILVIAPHPDDEALMFSGVIYSALSRGEQVKVVLMTNGDLYGVTVGNTRQDETVSAMVNSLGMHESNVIFLGYPDAGLTPVYNSYTLSSDKYTAANGQSATYGHRGLGWTDYHNFMFGAHATYNRPNILSDLKKIISDFLPDSIFMTSQHDLHPDHSITYSYVVDVLNDISGSNAAYKPIIHKTIIHGGDDTAWPLAMNPATDFTAPPIMNNTPLIWDYREGINVPFFMQNSVTAYNLKFNTILKYASQLNSYPDPLNNYLTSFVHKDELFWADNIFAANVPPIANAGQDQTVNEGTTVLLDGSASSNSNGASLTYQWTQIQGSTVTLSNSTSATPSFVSPTGLSGAQALVFQLVVYDGQAYSLPNTVTVTVLSASKYVNIATLATATASSQNSATGQLATKAIDGVTGGCPANCSAEWASVGQLAGAWLDLSWPQSYVVNKIVLFDMPNLNEQILDGTLTFSDGSTITVGPLTNSGSGDVYTFAAKHTSSVTLTVNQANGSNIGLAEIQAFGNISPTLAVTTTSLPSGTNGTAYSQLLSGTGGQPPYTWSITSGTLPAGLILEASSGTISGTPTATATKTFTVQVRDASLSTANKSLSITISNKPAVTTTSLLAGGLATAYSQTVAATGGQTPYTWSLSTGTLPAGLVLTPSSGTISGIPTTMGTSTFTVQVQDANQTAATKSLSIVINQYAPLQVSTASLPFGITGSTYSQTLAATGGKAPNSWSLTSGSLPAGLTLNASSGVISGMPTATGTSTFTVQVKDANLTTATKSLSIAVYAPLTVSTVSLPFGSTGTAYSQTMTATGGLAPYTWSVSSGSLPAGLTLNSSSGAITGTPTTTGSSAFTVQVKDANLTTATKSFTMVIYEPLSVSTTALSFGITGVAYSQTLAATGGLIPYTWSISSGALPTGLALGSSSGTISGTPTVKGNSTFTVQVKDANLTTATRSLSIAVDAPLVLSTSSLANGTVGTAYSQALTATGGKTPYSWTINSGTLPVGLTLNGSTGVISGTPTTVGTGTFTAQVKDANNSKDNKQLTLTIIAVNLPPVANNDSYSTEMSSAITTTAPGVLGNDTDPEGAALTAQLVSGTSHGVLILNSDGSFTYTQVTGYVGSDSFTYLANDGIKSSNNATVTISVSSAGKLLFADDFTRSVNPPDPMSPWTGVMGTWGVASGVMNGSGSAMSYSHSYYAPTPLWNNYAVEGRIKYASLAFGGGIGCRVNPATGAHYAAWVYPDNSAGGRNLLVLGKMWDWTTYGGEPMAQASLPGVGTGWHTLKMVCNGSRIQVVYDGTTKIDVTDNNFDARPAYLNGGINVGMWTFNNVNTMSVDDVVVNPLTPIAVNDIYSTNQNSVLTTAAPGILSNDTDPGGATLTAQLVSGPTHGTLVLDFNGSFTYTPAAGYAGNDSFTYLASNGTLSSANATVTITINLVNQPPVSNSDSFSTNRNTILTAAAPGVLSNDTDLEGAVLTAQLVSGPSHGTLVLNSNGSFTYNPTTNYTGSDSFVYRASDGSLTGNSATVNISVASAGTMLFSDDFTRSADPPPLSPWTSVMGTWGVTAGVMNGSGTAMSYSHSYYAPVTLWDNFAVEGRFRFAAAAFGGGIGCRVNPATGAHYAAWIYPDNSAAGRNMLVLGKMWDWTTYGGAPMAQASLPSVGTGWHTLKMVCNGNRIQVYYDGTAKIDVTDNNFNSRAPYVNGGINVAMWTYTNVNTMSVDDVFVSSVVP